MRELACFAVGCYTGEVNAPVVQFEGAFEGGHMAKKARKAYQELREGIGALGGKKWYEQAGRPNARASKSATSQEKACRIGMAFRTTRPS